MVSMGWCEYALAHVASARVPAFRCRGAASAFPAVQFRRFGVSAMGKRAASGSQQGGEGKQAKLQQVAKEAVTAAVAAQASAGPAAASTEASGGAGDGVAALRCVGVANPPPKVPTPSNAPAGASARQYMRAICPWVCQALPLHMARNSDTGSDPMHQRQPLKISQRAL